MSSKKTSYLFCFRQKKEKIKKCTHIIHILQILDTVTIYRLCIKYTKELFLVTTTREYEEILKINRISALKNNKLI